MSYILFSGIKRLIIGKQYKVTKNVFSLFLIIKKEEYKKTNMTYMIIVFKLEMRNSALLQKTKQIKNPQNSGNASNNISSTFTHYIKENNASTRISFFNKNAQLDY